MKLHMLCMAGANNKIVRMIVLPIKVFVVNLFFPRNSPSYLRFRYHDVLENISLLVGAWMIRQEYFSVVAFYDERFFAVSATTFHRTELCPPVTSNKWRAALNALDGCFDRRRGSLRRAVVQRNIVPSAISESEMLFAARLNGASALFSHRLSLLRKAFASLPKSVASRIAECLNSSRVNSAANCLSTVSAMIFIHVTHCDRFSDGNHYSLTSDGRRA